jgi:hypothetical protein
VPPPTGFGSGSPGHALGLGLLAALFAGRVAGQALVALTGTTALPPMSAWASGLVPYPLLLAIQVGLLAIQALVCRDVWRGRGWFGGPRPGWGPRLRAAGAVYAGVMLARYAITMGLHPERRWLGTGTIPVVFHWVLAAFFLTLGHFHAGPRASSR